MISACESQPEKTDIKLPNTHSAMTPLLNPESAWVDSVFESMSWSERIRELIWLTCNQQFQNFPQVGGLIINDTVAKQLIKNNYFSDTIISPIVIANTDACGFYKLGLTPSWSGLRTSDSAFIDELSNTYISLLKRYSISGIAQDSGVFAHHLPNTMTAHWKSVREKNHFITLDTLHPRLKFYSVDDNIQAPADSVEHLVFSTQLEDFVTDVLNGKATFVINAEENLDSLFQYIETLSKMVKTLPNFEVLLAPKVRKMLALKEYCTSLSANKSSSTVAALETNLIGLSNRLNYQGNCLLKNDGTLPLGDLPNKKWKYLVVGKEPMPHFAKGIRHFGEISEDRKTSLTFNLKDYAGSSPLIIILQSQQFDPSTANDWVKKVREAHLQSPIIVVAINCKNIHLLKELPVLVEVQANNNDAHYYLAQQLVGGLPITGRNNYSEFPFFSSPKTRLAFTIPEEVGIHKDSLKKIDKIAQEAILNKAAPGCQVFIAKEGKVLINKSYGYHAYDYQTAVNIDHVYDIASVTKVAATSMMAMHLYEKGRFNLNDSLKNYLPDTLAKFLKHPSRLNNITFQELLTHKSGLPSGLPIHKFIAYVNKLIGRFDRYYCDESNSYFCVEVAKDFYLDSSYLDSLWVDMNRIWPGEKVFKYSDANMNALYQVMRPMIKGKKSYDRYLDSVLYHPLQLKTMGFLPLKYLDTTRHRIAPTEYDTYWRYQVVKGYVHDPNAALYGGVAGNAGLFSNAFDLGILFQMLLQKGSYGGRHFFKPETVELFTKHQPGSHRGLGFDKPTPASGNVVAPDAPISTFGHTGFTGICAWADPENQLVFVFTSNRVHPNPNNKKLIEHGIRKRIHQVIYDQLFQNGTYLNNATGNIPYTKQFGTD
jgi:CubicO group peptidase (beta-lactamase class C family)